MQIVGIIGGSGLYDMEGLGDVERVRLSTPFGEPSDELVCGTLGEVRAIFLPRHGRGHRLLPSEVNYRANVFALKKLGAEWIVSVASVGSLKEEVAPGHIVVPDQLLDRTTGRPSTFFGGGVVAHVAFADPFCAPLSAVLIAAAREAGATVHAGGTYVCMEGPQFSTRAESHLYRQWGAAVVGMTNLQEAKLAREAEICFATLALATDYDCWRAATADVEIGEVLRVIEANAALARRVIRGLAGRLPAPRRCPCATALQHAIITDRGAIPAKVKRSLAPLLGKYVR